MLLLDSLHSFLAAQVAKRPNDLLDRVVDRSRSLEVQINVAQNDGEPVAGKRHTFSNGVETWSSIRIPYHADSKPEFNDDTIINWPLDTHADKIGTTGWNWREGVSLWAGYDIDSRDGHKGGLDDAALTAVIDAASQVPYIEIRRSSGGRGIHLYVWFSGIDTPNHTIHATLAKVLLAKMSQDAGFDFSPYIDVCGGNMWVWCRNQTPESFQLIKKSQGLLTEWNDNPKNDPLYMVPKDWRNFIPPQKESKRYVEKCAIILSDAQKQFVDAIVATRYAAIWQSDKDCLHTHTCAIKEVHADLKLRGVFDTLSTGEHPHECNCFCYPLDDDAWRVVRFSQGATEAPSWAQDGTGWTWCDVNRPVDLVAAAGAYGGVEVPKTGGFIFEDAAEAIQALAAMGISLAVPDGYEGRKIKLDRQKDGRTIIALERRQEDQTPKGWLSEKRGWFERLDGEKPAGPADLTDQYRLVYITEREDSRFDWWRLTHIGWRVSNRPNIHDSLVDKFHSSQEATEFMGRCVDKPWYFIDDPFGAEYPGNSRWNLASAQLRVQPTTKPPHHPTWDMVLSHTFAGLNNAIRDDAWCRENEILTGKDYALLWVACMLRKPFERVPYLFLFGKEACGKSTFHESLRHLITSNGLMDASSIVSGSDMFTGSIEHAVLAYIEEKSFAENKRAREIVKLWTGNSEIHIRCMRQEGRQIRNKLHLVHAANDFNAAPFDPSQDTRITMCEVPPLNTKIYGPDLQLQLQIEAPHVLRTLLELRIPPPVDSRFCLPMIVTEHKLGLQHANRTFIERFIYDNCCSGDGIPLPEFHTKYLDWAREQVDFDGNSGEQQIIQSLPVDAPLIAYRGAKIVSRITWKKPCTDH